MSDEEYKAMQQDARETMDAIWRGIVFTLIVVGCVAFDIWLIIQNLLLLFKYL